MSFTRAKPLGWVQGDKLTPTEIDHIDVNQSRAIDGTNGGTYTPSTPLTILGQYPPGGVHIEDLIASKITVAVGPVVFPGGPPISHGIAYRRTLLTMNNGDTEEIGCNRDYYRVLINSMGGAIVDIELSKTIPVPEIGEVINVIVYALPGAAGVCYANIHDGVAGPIITELPTPAPMPSFPQQAVNTASFIWTDPAWLLIGAVV